MILLLEVFGLLVSCDRAEKNREGARLDPGEAASMHQRDRLIAKARELEDSMRDSGSLDDLRNELASMKEDIRMSRERVSELEFGIKKVKAEIETKFK